VTNTSQQPYLPRTIQATFKTWIVRKENAILSEIPGSWTIEIRLSERGMQSRYKAMVGTVLQEFQEDFPMSKLADAKSYVRSQFKEQLTEWEVIEE
jgi:hypothetical protein